MNVKATSNGTIDDPIPFSELPALFDLPDAVFSELEIKYDGLCVIEDEGSYQDVKAGESEMTKIINGIEKVRVKAKQPYLEGGRMVDAIAKGYTERADKIRKPMRDAREAADQMRHEAKMAAIAKQEAEEKARLQAIEDVRLAEIKRQNDELAAQRAELEAEKAKIAKAQAEIAAKAKAEQDAITAAQKAESDRLAKERELIEEGKRAIQKAKEAAERAEFEAQAKVKAEADAKAALERQQAEDAARLVAAAEAAIERQKAIDAAMPDVEKIYAFASAIRGVLIDAPVITNPEAVAALAKATNRLCITANDLEAFKIGGAA